MNPQRRNACRAPVPSSTADDLNESSAKPRSFVIATSWTDSPISHQFRALARELTRRGHQTCVVVDRQQHVDDGTDGVPMVRTWPSDRPTHLRDLRFLLQLLEETGADTVIGNFGSVNLMLIGGWLRRVPRRVAYYHTLRSQLSLDGATGGLESLKDLRKRGIYRFATAVVANSFDSANDIVRTYGVAEARVTVQHYAVPDVAPDDFAPERLGLVCPGRLDWSKGQDVLIRALPELPDAHVSFIGGGSERPKLEALAVSLGVADRCTFHGTVPHHEVYEAMARSLLTVVPSRAEAFGLVSVESLACGTPVVASATGGLRDIIRDGVDGVLVDPDDPHALAAAIRRCIELGDPLRRNARERFIECFELSGATTRCADWLEAL